MFRVWRDLLSQVRCTLLIDVGGSVSNGCCFDGAWITLRRKCSERHLMPDFVRECSVGGGRVVV